MISGNDMFIDLASMLKKRGYLDPEALPWKEEKIPIRLVPIPEDSNIITTLTTNSFDSNIVLPIKK